MAPLPSHGSTLALSPDDTRLVVANEDRGTATVFAVDWPAEGPPALAKLAEIEVGAEVSQVAVHPSGDAAFVLSRRDQRLVRIEDLRGTPRRGAELRTGSEPTGVALTPRGTTAWVTSFVDGTVIGVDTGSMTVKDTIDLNQTIAASGLLGENLRGRPALAHPRSVAITNNGDRVEEDETLWVTDFYAYQKVPLEPTGANADVAKVGVVYKIPLASKEPSVVELPPMKDMGFRDVNDEVAGCFPNQLASIHVQGAFGYVLSSCASPRGAQGAFAGPAFASCANDDQCPGAAPGSCNAGRCTTNCSADAECGANGGRCNANVCAPNGANIKTQVAPAISIIDLGAAKTIATVNLAREFETYFDTLGLADDASRRMPLTMTDIGFVPGTVTAYVSSRGTDAVYRVDFNATYEASNIDSLGDPKAPFIDLAPGGVDPSRTGRLPTGVAVAHKLHPKEAAARYAFVANEATRNVSVLDLAAQEVAGRSEGTPVVAASTAEPESAAEADRVEGERLFATGLGRWSLKGQGWIACESCHADGLSDNVTWFFPRGPRQPNSIDGTVSSKDPRDVRVNNWTGIQDELADHEMGSLRGTAAGLGVVVSDAAMSPSSRIALDRLGHAGLSGSATAAADPSNPAGLPAACINDDWAKVAAFMSSIRSPRRPTNLDPVKVDEGRKLFAEGNCQGCHGGPKWTVSRVFYAPDPTNAVNTALKSKTWANELAASGFPAALWPAQSPAAQTMRYAGSDPGAFDQLTCVLRPVGTFGVAEPAVGVAELRRDMKTKAQGDEADGRGYNTPSLLSAMVGAPYFHAGQVRTLEALLASPFQAHREALAPGFLADGRPERIEALVQFLLSIDEDAEPIPVPALGPAGGDFCRAP